MAILEPKQQFPDHQIENVRMRGKQKHRSGSRLKEKIWVKPVIFAGIAQILPDQQEVRLEGAEGILIEDRVTGVSALLLYISLRSGLEKDDQ